MDRLNLGAAGKIAGRFILCLFLFISCSPQKEADSESVQETQSPPEETEIIIEAEQEKTQESVQDMPKIRLNPFLTLEEENALKEIGSVIPIDYLSLSAVLYSPKASRVIINGQILYVDDSIDNKRIIRIEPEAVILKDAQGEYIVRLKKVAGE